MITTERLSLLFVPCANIEDDADHNAAVNIAQRAFDDEVIMLVEKYPYSTNKRHAALKKLFEQRHRSYISVKPVA